MSIGITFNAKSKNPVKEATVAVNLAEASGYVAEEEYINRQHTVLRFEFCPGGEVFLNFHRGRIVCECRTNVAGPGFHAALVEFLDDFVRKCGLTFELHDETDYFTNRHFEQLQQEHFNRWLSGIAHVVSRQAVNPEIDNLMICWPLDGYRPKNIPGTIITPMGRYSVAKFVEYGSSKDGVAKLAEEFFVWNDKEKNARFYRNGALALLWTECYFMPSRRSDQDRFINARILDLLNKSIADPTLSFPKREYRELCELHGAKGTPVDSLPDFTRFDSIGYRRETITHTVGNLNIPLPGCFLLEIQKKPGYDHVFYDAIDDNWHELRLTAFQGRKAETEFDAKIFEGSIDEPITLNLEGVRCRAAYSGKSRHQVKGKPYYSVIAQAFSDKQINLMTLSFSRETERDWAFELLQRLTAGPSKKMEEVMESPANPRFFGFLSRIFGK